MSDSEKINLSELRELDSPSLTRYPIVPIDVLLALVTVCEAAHHDLAEVRGTHWADEWWPERLDAALAHFDFTQ